MTKARDLTVLRQISEAFLEVARANSENLQGELRNEGRSFAIFDRTGVGVARIEWGGDNWIRLRTNPDHPACTALINSSRQIEKKHKVEIRI